MSTNRAGYLFKEDHNGRQWKRRYFELAVLDRADYCAVLVYWKDASRAAPAVEIKLLNGSKISPSVGSSRAGRWPFSIKLLPASHTKGWLRLTLSGGSLAETLAWVSAIEAAGIESAFERSVYDGMGSLSSSAIGRADARVQARWSQHYSRADPPTADELAEDCPLPSTCPPSLNTGFIEKCVSRFGSVRTPSA